MPSSKVILKNMLWIFLSITSTCFSQDNYFTDMIPTIKNDLQESSLDLVSQRRIINLAKKTLDALQKSDKITYQDADMTKKELNDIFNQNWSKASYSQRAIYQVKSPLQFVYSKLIDPHASYLERFVYGAAVAAGVAITSYGVYRIGKYTYSRYDQDFNSTRILKEQEQRKVRMSKLEGEIAKQENNVAELESKIAEQKMIDLIKSGGVPYHYPDLVDPTDVAALEKRLNEIAVQEYVTVGDGLV